MNKKFNRKLVLNKKEITELTNDEMRNVQGGTAYSQGCSATCPSNYPCNTPSSQLCDNECD